MIFSVPEQLLQGKSRQHRRESTLVGLAIIHWLANLDDQGMADTALGIRCWRLTQHLEFMEYLRLAASRQTQVVCRNTEGKRGDACALAF
jgi:hypothetical protein